MLTLSLILFPLITAVAILLSTRDTARLSALVGTLGTLGLAVVAFCQFQADSTFQFSFDYAWLLSAADGKGGIRFAGAIDGISLLPVVLTALVTPLIVLSTFKQTCDGFLFYFFFEAALIPIYFLAALWGGENRVKVTFKFFVYTIFGSLLMLVALVYLYNSSPLVSGVHSAAIADFYNLTLTPAQQGWLFWAFFVAFAIKMPVFPFHTWQPDTYVEAPTPATMLLAGIMLKMGVYGLIRLLLPIVPEGVNVWGKTAIILSVIGIIYGAIIAVRQRDMKRLIAYSSFSHVGLMAAGVFSRSEMGLQGALIQILAHGVNVVGLFFIAELILQRTGTRQLDQLGGITRTTPRLTVYFMIILLGSVALPLTNGFVGEFLLLAGVYAYNHVLGTLAGLTIIFGAVYMLRMYQKSMFGVPSARTQSVADLSGTESYVLAALCFFVFWMGLYPASFLKLTEPAVTNLLQYIK
jgi:NADH-quinone oxidoreductase subunit M